MTDTVCYQGGCFCGRVRYEAQDVATNLCFCHCTSCRRAVGASPVPWATFAKRQFAIVNGRLAEHRSSPQVIRGFCADCGTSLTYCHDNRAGEIDVTLMTLDEPNVLAPEIHIWVQDKLPWVKIAAGQAQFEKFRSDATP